MTTETKTTAMEYVKTIGMISAGGRFTAGRGFTGPYALAIASDGRIYVVNRSQLRICVCDFEEQWLGSFSDGPGMDDGQIYLPTDLAFDSQDRLYVTDEHQHRVSMFDAEGEYVGKWGEMGSGDGQLNGPSGIAFDSQDNAYVVDQHNHRGPEADAGRRVHLAVGRAGRRRGAAQHAVGHRRGLERRRVRGGLAQ